MISNAIYSTKPNHFLGGPCSRSCGGGVSVETRVCSGAGPAGCAGPSKRYSSCNNRKCPGGGSGTDFRSEQCSEYNSQPFERKMYEWIPYLKAPRKCELNCMPRGERFYYRHAKKASGCFSPSCSFFIWLQRQHSTTLFKQLRL